MRPSKTSSIIALTLFALTVALPSAAQAIEGPFYRSCKNVGEKKGKFKDGTCVGEGGNKEWEKVRLEKGSIKFISGKVNKEFVLKVTERTIKCKKLELNGSSAINGSSKDEPGFGEEIIIFKECTVEGNGEGCKVEKGTIQTEIIKFTLAYAEKKPKEGTSILTLFGPAEGAVFAKVKFEGTCKIKETTIEGTVGAEAQNGKAETITVEKEPAEELAEDFLYPVARIKALFIGPLNAMGEAKEVAPKLTAFAGLSATLEGRSEIELGTKEAWGIVAD